MKKLIALVLALMMTLGMIACGAGVPEEPAKAADSTEAPVAEKPADGEKENVTLTAWFYNDPGAEEVFQKWAADVNAAYPWITIEYEVLPYDSGPEKFTVACATDTTPDLYYDGYSRIAPAVYGDLTMDLSDVVAEHADAFLGEQKDGIVDGKTQYIATGTGAAYGLFVNMDLVNELGLADMLPEDKLTWSYDDYLTLCRAAKAADPTVIPQALYAGSQSSDAWYYSWFVGNGVEITNADLTATAFNTGANRDKAIETLNVFKTLIDEGLANDGCASMTDQDCEQLWCAGKLLFLANSLNCASYYQNLMNEGTSVEFAFDTIALPTKDGAAAPVSACWGSNGFCAFDNNGNAEAAKLALGVWLDNPVYQAEYSVATGFMPLVKDTNIDWGSEALADIMDFVAVYTANNTTSSFGILEPWWTDFRGTFYPQMQDFYVGNIDAGTVLDNWQSAANNVIAGN